MTLHISVDTGCNLSCNYCMEEEDRAINGNDITDNYDMDKIMSRLEEMKERYPNEIPGLHGGEPLLLRDEDIETIFEWVYNNYESVRKGKEYSHIQTNGTLLRNKHIDIFDEYNVNVGISCDGPPELNQEREAAMREEATDRLSGLTYENIFKLGEADIPVGVIVVVHKANAGTDEKLHKLLNWMDELNKNGISGHYNEMLPYEDINQDLAVSGERMKEVFLKTWEWMKEEPYRTWNPMRQFQDNLLGNDLSDCRVSDCDVFDAGAAKIVDGEGETSGCAKTWAMVGDGSPFLQGPSNDSQYNDDHDRERILKSLPGAPENEGPDLGGCKGCDYWSVCYDDETEVLTSDGWKFFEDVTLQDEIATLNQDTYEVEYHTPLVKQTPEYNGDLIHWSGSTYDLRVTPDHNVFARSSPSQNFENHRASEIENNSAISFKRGGVWNGESLDEFTPEPAVLNDNAISQTPQPRNRTFDAEDWFEFVGWYLAEGSSQRKNSGNHRVTICQSQEKYRGEIKSLLERMDFNVYMGEKNIQFDSKQAVDHVEKMGTSEEKYIPEYIMNASRELIRRFLVTYAKGDGVVRDDDTPRIIYTNSEQMADNLQELGMKADWPSTKGVDERVDKGEFTSNSPVYHVTFAPTQSEVEVWTESEREEYDGTVYDLTVPNHTMYIRRDGKTLWSGNCHGGCPSAGIDEDHRNRTRWCESKYYLYQRIEEDMRTMFPNITLVTDLPWNADTQSLAHNGQLDIGQFDAMNSLGDGKRKSVYGGYDKHKSEPESMVPDDRLPDKSQEEMVREYEEEHGEENVTVSEENGKVIIHADSDMGQ